MAEFAVGSYDELEELVERRYGEVEETYEGEAKEVIEKRIRQLGYDYFGNGIYINNKQKIISYNPSSVQEVYVNNTDGVKLLPTIEKVEYDLEDDKYIFTTDGGSLRVPFTDTVRSVGKCLGIYIDNGTISKMAKDIFGIETVDYDDKWQVDLFWGNGKAYVPEDVARTIALWLVYNGYYDNQYDNEQYDMPTREGLNTFHLGDINSDIIVTAYRNYLYKNRIEFTVSQHLLRTIFDTISPNVPYNAVFVSCYEYYEVIPSLLYPRFTVTFCNFNQGGTLTKEVRIDNDGYNDYPVFYVERDEIVKRVIITFTDEVTFRASTVDNYGSNGHPKDMHVWSGTDHVTGFASNLNSREVLVYEPNLLPNAILPTDGRDITEVYTDWTTDFKNVITINPKLLEKDPPVEPVEPLAPVKYINIKIPSNDDDGQRATQLEPTGDTNIYNYYYYYTNTYGTPTQSNTGNTPSVDTPTSSTGYNLYSIFNPTAEELASFGAFIYSTDFFDVIDNMKKLFENPIDSVISLHICYFPVDFYEEQYIYLGNINTRVTAPYVLSQYHEISLGYLDYPAKYANVYDYEPYTTTQIYLPFIGIQHLNTADVVGGRIWITYRCDYLTGTCVADIEVERDGSKNLLYEFTGNVSVQIPITGRNYSQLIGNIIGGASNTIGNLATARSKAGAIGGAISGIGSTVAGAVNSIQVERSGNFTANAGAMCVKKPYLIITRNIPYQPSNYNMYYGAPANTEVKLGECYGYTRVKAIHVLNIDKATGYEKDKIENLLKEGISVLH